MPSIAVDQATGTLVVSWFDTRNDAANVRYATYITTSIDGGNTFAPDTYANAPNTAFDTITQQNVILGPIADDQSTGNPNADQPAVAGYTFGNHQGLAVYAGHVYAAWSGDQSGGVNEARPAQYPDRAHADRRRPAGRQQHDGRGHAPDHTGDDARGADHDQHPRPGHRDSPVRRVLRHVRPLRQSEHVHAGADRGVDAPATPTRPSCTWRRGPRRRSSSR